jgi:hypothetical protein
VEVLPKLPNFHLAGTGPFTSNRDTLGIAAIREGGAFVAATSSPRGDKAVRAQSMRTALVWPLRPVRGDYREPSLTTR